MKPPLSSFLIDAGLTFLIRAWKEYAATPKGQARIAEARALGLQLLLAPSAPPYNPDGTPVIEGGAVVEQGPPPEEAPGP